jgi:hypothetical protein
MIKQMAITDEQRKQIAKLHLHLQGLEILDYDFMGESLQQVRHRVLFVHSVIERDLEYMLATEMQRPLVEFGSLVPMDDRKNDPGFMLNRLFIYYLLSDMDFKKKIGLAEQKKLIKNPLTGKLLKVNDLRVYFSHPSSHMNAIRELDVPEKHIEVLSSLVAAHTDLKDRLSKYMDEVLAASKHSSGK